MAKRRELLGMTVLAGAGLLGLWPRHRAAEAAQSAVFPVMHTDAAWRSLLSPAESRSAGCRHCAGLRKSYQRPKRRFLRCSLIIHSPEKLAASQGPTGRRPVIKVRAPSRANRLATPRPIPALPPVRRATLSASLPFMLISFRNWISGAGTFASGGPNSRPSWFRAGKPAVSRPSRSLGLIVVRRTPIGVAADVD